MDKYKTILKEIKDRFMVGMKEIKEMERYEYSMYLEVVSELGYTKDDLSTAILMAKNEIIKSSDIKNEYSKKEVVGESKYRGILNADAITKEATVCCFERRDMALEYLPTGYYNPNKTLYAKHY